MAFMSYLAKKHPFGERDQRILRNLVIETDQPGAILGDFEILLDFIRSHVTDLTKKNNLIPIKFLKTLNERLTKPIGISLKRPRNDSFPHIDGLYLLYEKSRHGGGPEFRGRS